MLASVPRLHSCIGSLDLQCRVQHPAARIVERRVVTGSCATHLLSVQLVERATRISSPVSQTPSDWAFHTTSLAYVLSSLLSIEACFSQYASL